MTCQCTHSHLIETGKDTQYFSCTRANDNVAADSVQNVDTLYFPCLPWARSEGVRFGGESTDGAEINHVAGQLRQEHLLNVCSHLKSR